MRIDISLRTRAVMGLAGIVLLLGTTVVIINYGNGYYDGGYQLVARFGSSSQGLYDGSDVKVRGVNVGTVDSIALDEEGRALVTVRINEDSRIAETAAFSIEPLSIFGPKFINIRQGDAELKGPFFPPGALVTNTSDAVEFTLVLGDASDLLEHVDPIDVATVIHTLAEGIGGLGDEFAGTLDNVDQLAGILDANLPETRQFLADLSLVVQTLNEHSGPFLTAVAGFNEVLPVLNERDDAIGLLLDDVSRLSRTLGAILDTNADVVDSTLIGLAEVADLLNRRRGDVVSLVNSLNIFFGTLADVLRLDNQPISPLAGALLGGLANNPCQVFNVLPCLPTGAGTSATRASSASFASSAVPDAGAAPLPPIVGSVHPDPVAALADLVLAVLPTRDPVILASILGGGR